MSIDNKIFYVLIAVIISLLYSYNKYLSIRNYHNEIKEKGKITELYTRFLTKKESDFAVQQDEYCFVTIKGDTIKYRDKNEDRPGISESWIFVSANKKIIYNISKPNDYLLLEDFNSYSDYQNRIICFATKYMTKVLPGYL